MKKLLNTINNIKNNGILTPINIFTKKDENKIIKKILNSDKFKEIYPNTDKEKALSIIKCNFGLLASKEENNNYNHEFLVYDNGGSKEVFLYFEGSRARKWGIESEIIEINENQDIKEKFYKKSEEEQNKENLKLIFDTIESKIDNYIELVDDIEYFEKFIDGIVIYFTNGEVYQIFIDIDNKNNNNNNSIIVLDENINILYNSNDINYIIDNVINSVEGKNNYINNSKKYINL